MLTSWAGRRVSCVRQVYDKIRPEKGVLEYEYTEDQEGEEEPKQK